MRNLSTKDYIVKVLKNDNLFYEVNSSTLLPGDTIIIETNKMLKEYH